MNMTSEESTKHHKIVSERSSEISADNAVSETEAFMWNTLIAKSLRNTAQILYQLRTQLF